MKCKLQTPQQIKPPTKKRLIQPSIIESFSHHNHNPHKKKSRQTPAWRNSDALSLILVFSIWQLKGGTRFQTIISPAANHSGGGGGEGGEGAAG